jgi:flagellar hook-associated protein 3 FlgL
MKVTEMSMFRTLQNNLSTSSNSLNDLYLQAATGSKMIDASDDPSAIGSVFNSRTSIATSERYIESIGEAQDGIDILDGYLDTAEEIMVRAKEINVAAVNSASSAEDLATYADEVEELQNQLLSIANTKIDGKYIFSGYAEDTQPFSASTATYTGTDGVTTYERHVVDSYAGTSDHKMVEISSGQTVQTNLTGEEVFQSASGYDCFEILSDLEMYLRDNDTTALNDSLDDLEKATEQVRAKRSQMGNTNSRLDDVSSMLENLKLQMEDRLSSYQDADLVEVMSGISQAELTYESALNVTARLTELSIFDYL